MTYLYGYILVFIAGLFATPLCIRLAKKTGFLDKPNERKLHEEPVALLGGVSVFFVTWLGILYYVAGSELLWTTKMTALLGASLIIFVLGLIDDRLGTGARGKLVIQIVAASICYWGGIRLEIIAIPQLGGWQIGWLQYPFTVLWIISITNAMNLLDGLDGLCSGVTFWATLFMSLFALKMQQMDILMLVLPLNAAVLAFLRSNYPPAKIFLGDTGSLFIGFYIGVISLMSINKGPYAITVLLPIALLTVPILDTLMAILRRAKNKMSIFEADKRHLHHRILMLTGSYRGTLWIIYAVCIALGVIAYISYVYISGQRLLVFAGSYIIITLMLVFLGILEKRKS